MVNKGIRAHFDGKRLGFFVLFFKKGTPGDGKWQLQREEEKLVKTRPSLSQSSLTGDVLIY